MGPLIVSFVRLTLARPSELIKAAALHILQRLAFMEDSDVSDSSGQTTEIAFTQCHKKMCLAHPMSNFWSRKPRRLIS